MPLLVVGRVVVVSLISTDLHPIPRVSAGRKRQAMAAKQGLNDDLT